MVVAGGPEARPDLVRDRIGEAQRYIAADGGYRHLTALGLPCDVLVGDFDTLSPGEVTAAQRLGVTIEKHPPQKDQSDLELALAHAVLLGADRITVIGALGGEWDHCLANLLSPLSYLGARGVWGRLLTAEAEIYLCREGVLVESPGCRVSLQALSSQVTGLTLEGFQYPLNNAVLHRHQTLGLANRTLSEKARISFQSGELFLTVISSLPESSQP